MKRYFIIGLFIAFAALTNVAKAQIFLGEAFVGYNISQVDNDHYGIMEFHRNGLQAGVGVLTPIFKKKNFSIDLSLEVLYNQKGSYQGARTKNGNNLNDSTTIATGEYDLRLNYGEVPIMVYFNDKNVVSAGIGVSYARLTKIRLKEHGIDITDLKKDEFNKDEFNILADVKIRLYKRLKIGFRYSYSLTPVRTITNGEYYQNLPEDDPTYNDKREQRNSLFTFRLTYVFNENLDELHREEYRYTGDNPRYHNKAVERQYKKLKRQQEREARKAAKKNKE